jgi:DNA repair protein RadC
MGHDITITIHDVDLSEYHNTECFGTMLAQECTRALAGTPIVTKATHEKRAKPVRPVIDTTEKAAKQFDFIKDNKSEHFAMITLDGARHLIATRVISIGTLTSSPVHPREVFAPAIEDRANSIIIAHNHPSGSLTVGKSDRETTDRIRKAGELLGIRLDEHIIVTSEEFTSAM